MGPHLRPATSTCRCRRSSPTPSAPTAATTRTASPRPARQLAASYRFLEDRLPAAPWALGPDFGLADCAAAPALFYADVVQPLGPAEPRLKAYLDRLVRRPSYAGVLAAAAPYFPMFPLDPKPRGSRPDTDGRTANRQYPYKTLCISSHFP